MRYQDFLNEQLKDPEFAKAYAEAEPEANLMRAILDARTKQNLTQKELSERSGIAQAEISKLEKGLRNPTIKLLQRIADSLDMVLQVTFIPKSEYYKNK